MDQALKDLGDYVSAALPGDILKAELRHGELALTARRDTIVKLLTLLRDDRKCEFQLLVDLCGADYPGRAERFDIVYNLLSLTKNRRVRIKVMTDETTPVPSVSSVYSTANWFEREAWDLFGVFFSGHPDLRRLLTDYGFEGHPMRKDFPLTGHVEVRYDDEQKRVVYEPVKLIQEFRTFDFLSPWEGITKVVLPGDEKAGDEKAGARR